MERDDSFEVDAVTEAALALKGGATPSEVRRIALESGHDPDLLMVLAESFLDR